MRKLWSSIRLAAGSRKASLAALLDGPAFVFAAVAVSIVAAVAISVLVAKPARSDSLPLAKTVAPPVAAPAAAPSKAPSWSGPWVGAHLGLAAVATEIDGLASLAGDGIQGGLSAGYNLQSGVMVGGPWAEYTFADLETRFAGERVTLEGAWAGGLRGGVLVNPRLYLYGLYGWTEAEASASFGRMPTFGGVVYGGGLEALLAGDSLSVRLEYRGTALRPETIDGSTIEPDHHAVRVGLTWLFAR